MQKGRCEYVKVVEWQKERRVPHIHALAVGGLRDIDTGVIMKYAWENIGWNRIVRYDKDLGANFYLGKYLAKSGDIDVEFSKEIVEEEKRRFR